MITRITIEFDLQHQHEADIGSDWRTDLETKVGRSICNFTDPMNMVFKYERQLPVAEQPQAVQDLLAGAAQAVEEIPEDELESWSRR